MPLGERSILDVVLHQLRYHGVEAATLAVGHLAELIKAYCGSGERFGLKLDYSKEDTPLGTAGPLALLSGFDESFLVMNGDVLTTLDYAQMRERHEASEALVTLAVHRRSVCIDFGVVEFDAGSQLTEYIEKPDHDFWVSMGVYIMRPEVLDYVSAGDRMDLPDLVSRVVESGERVECYQHQGYWLDIGRHDDYKQAIADFAERGAEFLPDDA